MKMKEFRALQERRRRAKAAGRKPEPWPVERAAAITRGKPGRPKKTTRKLTPSQMRIAYLEKENAAQKIFIRRANDLLAQSGAINRMVINALDLMDRVARFGHEWQQLIHGLIPTELQTLRGDRSSDYSLAREQTSPGHHFASASARHIIGRK